MGLSEDVRSREGLIASMASVSLIQFIFVRNLSLPVLERWGDAGATVLQAAFREFGEWRGEGIRRAYGVIAQGADALTLLRNWDSCDFALEFTHRPVRIEGDASHASVTLRSVPGLEYFDSKAASEILQLYWPAVLQGVAYGFDSSYQAVYSEIMSARWTITIRRIVRPASHHVAPSSEPISDPFEPPESALALIRRSSRNNGALYMFIAKHVIDKFGASGEEVVRKGVRGIGSERGKALREKHLRDGKALNLKNLMSDWDGPLVSTWVFREEGHLSEGTWHQDCVYCPYAEVWAEYGPDGLRLGYLYDVELHTTMYETYYPGTIVRWEQLKTRGDHLCKFRFSIPALVVASDPPS